MKLIIVLTIAALLCMVLVECRKMRRSLGKLHHGPVCAHSLEYFYDYNIFDVAMAQMKVTSKSIRIYQTYAFHTIPDASEAAQAVTASSLHYMHKITQTLRSLSYYRAFSYLGNLASILRVASLELMQEKKHWNILMIVSCMNPQKLSTHLPLMPHICVGELDQHWFR